VQAKEWLLSSLTAGWQVMHPGSGGGGGKAVTGLFSLSVSQPDASISKGMLHIAKEYKITFLILSIILTFYHKIDK
jgi:hypothetical protein